MEENPEVNIRRHAKSIMKDMLKADSLLNRERSRGTAYGLCLALQYLDENTYASLEFRKLLAEVEEV